MYLCVFNFIYMWWCGGRTHAIRFPEEEIVTAGKLDANHWFELAPTRRCSVMYSVQSGN